MSNANALAQFLHGVGGNVTFAAGAGLAANDTAHMLFAYSDGANVHIADVEFANSAPPEDDPPSFSTDSVNIVAAHDMVELVGVNLTAINSHNIHLLA